MFIVFPELKPQFPGCLVIISSLNLVKELTLINIFVLTQKEQQINLTFFPIIIKM